MHQTNTTSTAISDQSSVTTGRGKASPLHSRRSVLKRSGGSHRSNRRVTFNLSIDEEISRASLRHYWRDSEIKRLLECLQSSYPGTWSARNEKEKQCISRAIAEELFGFGYKVNPKTVNKKIAVLWAKYNECLDNGDEAYKFYSRCHGAFTRSEYPAATVEEAMDKREGAATNSTEWPR